MRLESPPIAGAELAAARARHDAMRRLLAEVFSCLTRRRYGIAVLKLEEAVAAALAVEWYLGPDERALDQLVATAAVLSELSTRLQLRVLDQATEVLRAAVDLRTRIHLGEK